jgi:hypothetical protein
MTPVQCLAARNLLNWGQSYLARQSSITIVSVQNFEAAMTMPRPTTLAAMKAALEAGIEFTEGSGRERG